MASVLQNLTWDDIKNLPETGGRTEIVDGELVMSPTPNFRHQKIAGRLGLRIAPFVETQALGEFGLLPLHVILAPHVHYEPDLWFVRADRVALIEANYINGAPDLAIEILSPGNREHDLVVKLRDYERYGVGEYWIVDPDSETILVYRRDDDASEVFLPPQTVSVGASVESPLFPGFRLDPADVF